MYYAGIGARKTPKEILELFGRVAYYLASKGLVLRSGGAGGADKAFENGCDAYGGMKEIYVPWLGFQGSTSKLVVESEEAFEIAEKYHPSWVYLKESHKKLHARNCHQVLGYDLKTYSSFIICWTEGGKGQGGTGQALRIAKDYGIEVFDCGNYSDINECRYELYKFLSKYIQV